MLKCKTILLRSFRWLVIIVLLSYAGFPILFLFVSAFKAPKEIFAFPPRLLFRPTLINFRDLIRDWLPFLSAFKNSVIVAFSAAVVTVVLTAPAGYAFSRFKQGFFSGSAFFLLIIRMYPPIVLTVPLFPFFAEIGLADSPLVLVLLYSTFNISVSAWLMKTFMDEVPKELEEAASLDGANTFQLITKIILPLSFQGIAATAVFVVIFAWKEYVLAYIFTTTRSRTAPIVLAQMLSPVTGIEWGPLFAAATLQLIPVLVFILLIQKYLIRGVMIGGVKG